LINEHADESGFEIAEVYGFRGQSDEAMYWLERASKGPFLVPSQIVSASEDLAEDPGFKSFLHRMNLPE
jgi:hypothetical protein